MQVKSLVTPGYGFLLIIALQSVTVIGEKQLTEDTAAVDKEQYANIFNQMPKVLSYIIQLIERQPQVLETNDLKVFETNNLKVFKREATEPLRDKCHGSNVRSAMEKLRQYVEKVMKKIKRG